MVTRWRIYILFTFLLVAGVALTCIALLRRRGVAISRLQALLFVVGLLLTVETLIVAGLSNFNLGVILPAVIGLPLMLVSIFLPQMQAGLGLTLKRILIALYGLAGLVFLVMAILMGRATHHRGEADAIIVLGAAVHGDRVTWVLENRLTAAMAYLNEHPAAIAVVSGGQGRGESVTEASAMKRYMVAHGIAPERVYLEERAVNTRENLRFSKAIIDAALGENARLAFVTTDFHVFRTGMVAKSMGLDCFGIPARDVWYLRLNNFLRETVAILVYAMRGWA